MIIEIPKVSDKLNKRTLTMKGELSNLVDITEAYRDLCAEYGVSVMKMKSFTKSQTKTDIKGLMMLCVRLDCIIVVDSFMDFFFIKYPHNGDMSLDLTEFAKGSTKEGGNNRKFGEKKVEAPKEERFVKVETESTPDQSDTANNNTEVDIEEELF